VCYIESLRPHQPITAYVIRQLLQLFRHRLDDEGKLRMSILPSTPQTQGVTVAFLQLPTLLN